jgi:hypothetical protein
MVLIIAAYEWEQINFHLRLTAVAIHLYTAEQT